LRSTPGASAVVDGGLQACVDALPPHPRRRGFLPVAALPRTVTGKLLRQKLQDLHRTLRARQQASSVKSTERQAH
jgi:acyl-coenzyme A synthetase/AMP-(fatty) acid ligase